MRTYQSDLELTAELFGPNSLFELVSVLEIMADHGKDRQTVEDDLSSTRAKKSPAGNRPAGLAKG